MVHPVKYTMVDRYLLSSAHQYYVVIWVNMATTRDQIVLDQKKKKLLSFSITAYNASESRL